MPPLGPVGPWMGAPGQAPYLAQAPGGYPPQQSRLEGDKGKHPSPGRGRNSGLVGPAAADPPLSVNGMVPYGNGNLLHPGGGGGSGGMPPFYGMMPYMGMPYSMAGGPYGMPGGFAGQENGGMAGQQQQQQPAQLLRQAGEVLPPVKLPRGNGAAIRSAPPGSYGGARVWGDKGKPHAGNGGGGGGDAGGAPDAERVEYAPSGAYRYMHAHAHAHVHKNPDAHEGLWPGLGGVMGGYGMAPGMGFGMGGMGMGMGALGMGMGLGMGGYGAGAGGSPAGAAGDPMQVMMQRAAAVQAAQQEHYRGVEQQLLGRLDRQQQQQQQHGAGGAGRRDNRRNSHDGRPVFRLF